MDTTKGNVYRIQFQWLGFGAITYSVEIPSTGGFLPVHRVEYANSNIVASVANPSFPFTARVENTSNTTNITIRMGCIAIHVEGIVNLLGPSNSVGNTKTGVTTTLTNVLTIQNKTTFAGITSKVPIHLKAFSVAVDGNKPAELQLIMNTTLGGTPSYADIGTNTSVISFDTAGTTITGGTVIDTLFLGKADSEHITPNTQDIVLAPGDTLTFAVAASATTTDASVAAVWIEDF